LEKKKQHTCLKAVLSKARRYGYLPTDFHSLEDLLDSNDESLFRFIRYNPQHVLHQLQLPPPKQTGYIISVLVDTASPSLLYLQSSCAKTSLTACFSKYSPVCKTSILMFYRQELMFYRQDCTLFTLMLILFVCIVCLHFHCLLCFAFDKVLLKNSTTSLLLLLLLLRVSEPSIDGSATTTTCKQSM